MYQMIQSRSARVRFLNELAQDEIRSISNDITEYYLSITRSGLLLICEPFVNVTYSFPIAYSPVLLRIAERGYEVYFDSFDKISWDEFVEDPDPDPEPIVLSTDQECPICYESFKDVTSMVALCGHGVCMKCLVKMAEKNMNKCPICRSESFKWLLLCVGIEPTTSALRA